MTDRHIATEECQSTVPLLLGAGSVLATVLIITTVNELPKLYLVKNRESLLLSKK